MTNPDVEIHIERLTLPAGSATSDRFRAEFARRMAHHIQEDGDPTEATPARLAQLAAQAIRETVGALSVQGERQVRTTNQRQGHM